ncbi:MAG: cell division protein ZapD [Gammaproteobacteria bacterium]
MTKYILYEQPLNERIRTFLRIEYLFDMVYHHIDKTDPWSSRAAIQSILELDDLLSRSDIKSEVIMELERHATTLTTLHDKPGVDAKRLQNVLDNISDYLQQLKDHSCLSGQVLKEDELFTSIKRRHAIPGGTCNFDLPNYHYWLNYPAADRIEYLKNLLQDTLIVRDSVSLALTIIRNSTNPSSEVANGGFYQRPVESNLACQLIRVKLPVDIGYFPEISGGKHRFSIRFMEQTSTLGRPAQVDRDIEFELHCCIL